MYTTGVIMYTTGVIMYTTGVMLYPLLCFTNLVEVIYSTSTRAGEGAICRYLSRQGKIAEDIHETKSSGIFLS